MATGAKSIFNRNQRENYQRITVARNRRITDKNAMWTMFSQLFLLRKRSKNRIFHIWYLCKLAYFI
jgi:hypothetical protein